MMAFADDPQMASVGSDDRDNPVNVANGAGPSSDEPMPDAAASDVAATPTLEQLYAKIASLEAELESRPARAWTDVTAPATVTGARLADVNMATRLAQLFETTDTHRARLDSLADGNRYVRLPKSPKPDKFYGSNDVLKVGDFLSLTQLWIKVEQVLDILWSVFAMQFSSGMASDHFASVTRGVDMMAMPWSRFCEIPKSAYGKPNSEPAARLALDALKWPGSVSGLARHMGKLVSQVTRVPLSIGDQIHRFQKTLPSVLGDKCRAKPDSSPWDDLQALIEFAAMHETYLPSLPATSAVVQSSLGVTNGSGVQKIKGTGKGKGA